MFKIKKVFILITTTVGMVLSAFYFYIKFHKISQFTDFHEINSSDTILIFSPHPDDEALGAGGIIKKALKKNATVIIVEMTNGDYITPDEFKTYQGKANTDYNGNIGEFRQIETINAMKNLGLNKENIIFLGYPDGGLKPLFEEYWNNLFHMNNGSNLLDHSPYTLTFEVNAPCSGSNVEKNIKQIINEYTPTMIFYPDPGDYHPDHSATSAFVSQAIIETNYHKKKYTYLVHHHNWPRIINLPYTNILIPSELTTSDADWVMNKLNNNEKNDKKNAIFSHDTQMENMDAFLMSFIRNDEFYTVYPEINITKVDGLNSIKNQTSLISHTIISRDLNKGIFSKYITTTSGISYDDENIYLFLQFNNQPKIFYLHLKLLNENKTNQIDLTIENNSVKYESFNENSLKSDQNPGIITKSNTSIIILPKNLLDGIKTIMMSTSYDDTQTNQETFLIPWRTFQFKREYKTKKDN